MYVCLAGDSVVVVRLATRGGSVYKARLAFPLGNPFRLAFPVSKIPSASLCLRVLSRFCCAVQSLPLLGPLTEQAFQAVESIHPGLLLVAHHRDVPCTMVFGSLYPLSTCLLVLSVFRA